METDGKAELNTKHLSGLVALTLLYDDVEEEDERVVQQHEHHSVVAMIRNNVEGGG